MGLHSAVSSTPAIANQETLRIQLTIENLHKSWKFTITAGGNKSCDGKGCVSEQHPLAGQGTLCGRHDIAAMSLGKMQED